MTYELSVAGLKRQLKLSKIAPDLMIAGFVVFGDVELTVACARELLKKAPEYDYIIAPEAKAIPLIHEMARQSGRNDYLLARKAAKAYMDGVFISEEMGTQKPAPEFFEKVFAALEWPDKEKCIILGDSQSSDMLGGKNAGIATCWYNPKGEIKKGDWAFEIRSLEQFLEVVS